MDGETSKDTEPREERCIGGNSNLPWTISVVSLLFTIFSFTWRVTHVAPVTCTVIDGGKEWNLSGGIKTNRMLSIEEMAKLHSVDVKTVEAWVNTDMVHPHPVKYREEKTLYLFEPEHTVKMK